MKQSEEEREKEWKKKAKKTEEVIHIEFDTDGDGKVHSKNAKDGNTEGKVRIKKQYTFMNLVVKMRAESKPS